jgi:putative tRNA adenosine deaminase-associated protein
MAEDGFAVTVYREGERWQCALLPPAVLSDLDHCVAALRQQPKEGGPFALVDVDDEFFVALRLAPSGEIRVLLSDATAAVDWDLARQAVELLGEELPVDEDLDEVWPAGDLGMFADLGLDERDLGMILDDLDLYADEMLSMIARRIGVGEAYAQVVEAPTG